MEEDDAEGEEGEKKKGKRRTESGPATTSSPIRSLARVFLVILLY